MTPEAEQLVADHIGLAKTLAGIRCRRGVPHRWWGDMEGAALEGLIDAAGRFDPGLGYKFATFAAWRINGAMGDELRKVHTGRPSETGGVNWRDRAEHETSLDAIVERARTRTGAGGDPTDHLDFLAGPNTDPAEIVETRQDRRGAFDLLDHLNSSDRQIATWYYLDGLRLADIGRRLGVGESRACQRMTAIKAQLRRLAASTGLAA